jgi:hypothetical protein
MARIRPLTLATLVASAVGLSGCAAMVAERPHRNVILFVADGLRTGSVNAVDTPTMLRIRQQGVFFANSHSLFPTFTTPNASAIATGHYLGDTGDFSNTVYAGFPIFSDPGVAAALKKKPGTVTPFLESNQVLADVDEHFAQGNFLSEETLLSVARKAGYQTAAIGKIGPVGIQDVTQITATANGFSVPATVIIDDNTGRLDGAGVQQSPPVRADVAAALDHAGVGLVATARNQPAGNVATAGTRNANALQQQYFVDAATKAVLPTFRASGKPFVLVYWSRDPDGSQHNQGDSLNTLSPGINGPTSVAGVANADANLKQIFDYIQSAPELAASTDIFVTADHGFATISKHETDASGGAADSYATTFSYNTATLKPEVVAGWLPPGFLSIDLAHELGLPLFDPDVQVSPGICKPVDPAGVLAGSEQRPASGNGVLGGSGTLSKVAAEAKLIVAANGGSDLIYLPNFDRGLLERTVHFLLRQNYVGGLFVNSAYGPVPGTLPLTAINMEGVAKFPTPTIAVAFKTFALDVTNPLQTAIQVADTTLQEGQGMHGSLGRDNTYNNMAAIGPDFKASFVDSAPVSNADIARTLAHILGLPLPSSGALEGRVLYEALSNDERGPVAFEHHRKGSADPVSGKATVLEFQSIGRQHYFDQACLVDVRGEPADATPRCP